MTISQRIKQFITAINAFDVDATIILFAKDAVIDDESVGRKFKNTKGVRNYLETFFVGYKTISKLMSVEVIDSHTAKAQLDFTGNFGHETGVLIFTLNKEGLIVSIKAYLD